MRTIQLLINSTMGINGTVVRCDDIGTGNLIAQTILLVQGEYEYNIFIIMWYIHVHQTVCTYT